MSNTSPTSANLKILYEELYKVYTKYCKLGNHHTTTNLDSRSWKKIVIESGLLAGSYTRNDIDLTFVRVKGKQSNTINFDQFLQALEEVAQRSHQHINNIIYKVATVEGPRYIATQPDLVRFYDDKSTYTGVYAHGGPSYDKDGKITLSDLVNRANIADPRGVKIATRKYAGSSNIP